MEQPHQVSKGDFPGTNPNIVGVKMVGPIASVDTALGEILEVESSPKLERKVLLKIDLV